MLNFIGYIILAYLISFLMNEYRAEKKVKELRLQKQLDELQRLATRANARLRN